MTVSIVELGVATIAASLVPTATLRKVTQFANPKVFLLEGLLVAAALRAARRPATAACLAAPLAIGAGNVLKRSFPRTRPWRSRFDRKGRESFPSTHVAGPIAVLVSMRSFAPRSTLWRIGVCAGAAFAAIVARERVLEGAHWPMDVAAGAALGFGTGALLCRFCRSSSTTFDGEP